MEMKLIRLSAPEEIFVDIRESEIIINDPYKGTTFPVKDNVMLHSSTGYFNPGDDITFLGMNKVFKEIEISQQESLFKGEEIPELDRKSFWLKNSELFACLCAIIYPWFDDKNKIKFHELNNIFLPNDWMEILNPIVITISPSKNWYGFIVDLNIIKKLFSKEIISKIDSLHQKGFSLKLLSENSLGNNNSANICIQISDNNPLCQRLTANDNYFNYDSLTLEIINFNFTYGKTPNKIFKYFNKRGITISQLVNEFSENSNKFIKAIKNFDSLFDLMSQQKLDETSYNALLLDLYDTNRNTSSVDLDDRLKNIIKKAIKNRDVFLDDHYNNQYSWAHLIKRVVRNNAEDIFSKVKKNPNEITHLFSKKRVIEKMERIYTAISSRDDKEKEMKKYLQKQVDSFDEVKKYISK